MCLRKCRDSAVVPQCGTPGASSEGPLILSRSLATGNLTPPGNAGRPYPCALSEEFKGAGCRTTVVELGGVVEPAHGPVDRACGAS
eukprot:644002-Hanusia_phi.AAC.1